MSGHYYRYEDRATRLGVTVYIYKYPIVKHTPKGVWLDVGFRKRFVLTDARKRFACPTTVEARLSFEARKKKQIQIYEKRLRQAYAALEAEPVDLTGASLFSLKG